MVGLKVKFGRCRSKIEGSFPALLPGQWQSLSTPLSSRARVSGSPRRRRHNHLLRIRNRLPPSHLLCNQGLRAFPMHTAMDQRQ